MASTRKGTTRATKPADPAPAAEADAPPAVGVTLRDYLAGQAVTGLVAALMSPDVDRHVSACKAIERLPAEAAQAAYAIADAMLAERHADAFARLAAAVPAARTWVNAMQRAAEGDGGRLSANGPAARDLANFWGALDALLDTARR